jgi:Cys-rich repeat protein
MSYQILRPLFFFGALSFLACQEVSTDRRTVLLADTDGNGYAASGACGVEPALTDDCGEGEPTDDCVIFPNPDGCALIQWSEEHTVITDENGNIIEETYTTCTQCLDENANPVGEEECSSGGGTDPVVCYTIDSDDPTVSCWECSSPDGEVVYGGCDPLPVYCASDEECPDGQFCQLFPTFPPPECDDNTICPLPPVFAAEGICTIPVQGCFSDFDCNAGEVCEFIDVPCPEGEACPALAQGICVVSAGGCDSLTDEQSCSANGCQWALTQPACLGGPSGEGCPGFCLDPQEPICYSDADCGADEVCQLEAIDCPPGMACPAVMEGVCVPAPDECSQITDQESCSANPDCGWFAFGMPCVEGEPCISGVCQTIGDGCGDDVTILPAP